MSRSLPVILLALSTGLTHAIIPDLTFSEKTLKANRYFLNFLNQGVSNFGSSQHVTAFKEIQQLDYNARLYHVSNDFNRTFLEIRKSQAMMRDLYHDLLESVYLKTTKALLDDIAANIIQTRDARAYHLMKLSYRDLQEGWRFLKLGYHSNKFLYSVKIRLYIDGIKMARRAKRYAILALIEKNTPIPDKAAYKRQTLDEALTKVVKEDITDFEAVRNQITNFMNRKLIAESLNLPEHHYDNYGYISRTDILKDNIPNLKQDQIRY